MALRLPNTTDLPEKSGAADRMRPTSDTLPAYERWIVRRPSTYGGWHGAEAATSLAPPLFDVVFELPDGATALLAESVGSVLQQRYANWQVTIFARTPPAADTLSCCTVNLQWITIPDAASSGDWIDAHLQQSTADWVGLFPCGTRLAPDLLTACADHIAARPHWRLIYTDEDSIDARGRRHSPLFKPDINPDLLRSTDYVGGILVARDALLRAGGYGNSVAATRYDATLRILDAYGEASIGHIADVLCHVPNGIPRCATSPDMEQYLLRHMERRGIAADILPGLTPGLTQRIRYRHAAAPEVSIIIPNRNSLKLLGQCIESLFKQTRYPHWEILIVDNGSDDTNLLAYYAALMGALPGRVRILDAPGEFNYSAMNNLGAQEARGEYLLLLNNDTQALHDDWLDVMMGHAQRPNVGIVGARLLFPDSRRIQHAGIVLGMDGGSGHVFINQLPDESSYMLRAQCDQNYSAVTGACLLIRAALYREAGGLDEADLKICYNDVDLCLKIRRLGYRVLWTPFATLLHHGSASQKQEHRAPDKKHVASLRLQQEAYTLIKRWRAELANDPAWNRNLSLSATQPAIEDELVVPWNPDFHDRQRILAMPVVTQGQAEYRSFSPLRALQAASLAHCATICQPQPGYDRAPTPIELVRLAPDTLLMHAPVDDTRCIALLHYKQLNPEVLRVYSLDDLITDIPTDNPSHKGLPAAVVAERLRLGLAASDRLIVSTEPLAAAYQGMIDDIRIVPNMLEKAVWGTLQSQRRGSRKPRVGWAGAQQHAGDLRFIIEVVKATHAEVDWVFFGMMPEGVRPYLAEFHEFVHQFADYPAKLASLDLDLAIAPLAVHPFNAAKSNLRLLEYGVLGWPVICTDITPYRTDLPPVTRLPNDSAAWSAAIREKTADRPALAREGDVLREWVTQNYWLENNLERWHNALSR